MYWRMYATSDPSSEGEDEGYRLSNTAQLRLLKVPVGQIYHLSIKNLTPLWVNLAESEITTPENIFFPSLDEAFFLQQPWVYCT